jgi:hypothetical protein
MQMQGNFVTRSMPLSNWSVRLSSFCAAVVALALIIPFAGGQTQTANPPAKKTPASKTKGKAADTVPDGPPMTLDAIVRMLKAVKQGVMDQPRILAFIAKRNIAFDATGENLSTLMSNGANPEILDKVAALRPPPPPPPPPIPPKPVTGTLSFVCAPVECMIRIDGGPDKATTNGKLSIDDLVYKQYTVDFRKEGFAPKSERITVNSETSREISIKLEVKSETLQKWGEQLYISALQALVGARGLAEFKALSATGGASSWNEQGMQTEWTIKSTMTADINLYELTNPSSGVYSIACQDETCGPPKGKSPKGKKASGPEAEALNTNLRQYNRYRLTALMQRIKTGNRRFSAVAAPVAGQPNHLLVASPDETYDLTLDANNLPIAVLYRSSDGLASAKITYSEYLPLGTVAKYPRLTSIALPGDKQHGIRVKYDAVSANPSLGK